MERPEDIYNIKVDNIENFENFLKNKTLLDLEKLPDSPIDLPIKKSELKHKSYAKIKNKYSDITNSSNSSAIKNNTNPNITNLNEYKLENGISDKTSNNIIENKEKNSLLSDIKRKENFRFLNKLSENDHFSWLKFKQNNIDKDEEKLNSSGYVNTNNNNENKTEVNPPPSNVINKDMQIFNSNISLLKNKIKDYYYSNKNIFEKIHSNLTRLDKNILDINLMNPIFAAREYNRQLFNQNSTSNSVKKLQAVENNTNIKFDTSFIQQVKNEIGSNFKNIANRFLKGKNPKEVDLKGNNLNF